MRDNITILGAGVAGLTLAAEMTARGVPVTVVDPGGAPGQHGCSWWAGGMLAPDCEGFSAEPAVVTQGRQAADWWAGQGVDVARAGTLVVSLARDRSEITTFARRVPAATPIDGDMLAQLEPDLAGRFAHVLYLADEAHIDPRRALQKLHATLQAAGVTFTDAPPNAGLIVDCRGLSAQDTLPDLRGVKGEMVIVRCPDIRLTRPVRLLHPRFALYIVPRGDGVFMLGATQIETGERGRATVRSVLDLLGAAYALHPAFGEAEILEIGVDARPAFPDNMPRIRRLPDRLCLNGLFRHGFLLAPAMARMTADLLVKNAIPEVWYEDHSQR